MLFPAITKKLVFQKCQKGSRVGTIHERKFFHVARAAANAHKFAKRYSLKAKIKYYPKSGSLSLYERGFFVCQNE